MDRTAYLALIETLRATWPEVNFFIRTSSVNKRNFQNAGFSLPWVSISYKDKMGQSTDYGTDNYAWIQEVDVTYVSSTVPTSAIAGSGYDVTSHILARLTNAAIAVCTSSSTGYQVIETPSISVNEMDETNKKVTPMIIPIATGTLKIKLVIGQGAFS